MKFQITMRMHANEQSAQRYWRRSCALVLAACCAAAPLRAQTVSAPTPPVALSLALTAACRQNPEDFAGFLTAESAGVFRVLPGGQKNALMERFVLLDSPGRPLLSSDAKGRPVLRCESAGVTVLMRFGDTRLQDNLAFVPVEASVPGDKPGEPDKTLTRRVQFGLVRESGQWKLLSVGLLLLDLPALSRQWSLEDAVAREEAAINALRDIARGLTTYRNAFGKLPESLAQLGPAPKEGISEEAAGVIDAELAAGSKGGYTFRYRIVPPRPGATGTDTDSQDGFELAASPVEYGKTGERSFFLDSTGILRGDDKKGAVATVTDPVIDARRPPR
jgi:hypothetical protein